MGLVITFNSLKDKTLVKKEKVLASLEQRRYHKCIIGASLTDLSRIENYSYCFTCAGADVIDISAFPHSVIAAKTGINKATKESPDIQGDKNEKNRVSEPLIMVSVNIDSDPHFRRIKLNTDKCTECKLCIPSCPSGAFSESLIDTVLTSKTLTSANETFYYEADLCFGCSNCLDYCHFNALEFENWSASDPNELNRLFELGASAFEIHSSNNFHALQNFYSKIDLSRVLLESFSIGSEKMTDDELAETAKFIIKLTQKRASFENRIIVIQCDGIPQSGARLINEDKDLKSIRNAEIVLNTLKSENLLLPNVFIQIAGGTDKKSLAKAHQLGIMVHGVALGSWLRKRILELDTEAAKRVCTEVLEESRKITPSQIR